MRFDSAARGALVATCASACALLVVLAGVSKSPAQAQASHPATVVIAHEWGVWKLDHGRVEHLEELANECPAFVRRVPSLTPPPPTDFRPVVARKPVLFLYSDRATPIQVEVGFQGGQAWLHYPGAEHLPAGAFVAGGEGLRFSGQLVPRGTAPLEPVAPGHFWNDLRDVGAALFLASDGTAERFLFYDGPVDFQPGFLLGRSGTGAAVTAASSEETVWIVDRYRFTENRIDPGRGTTVAEGDMAVFRARLDDELQRRGLTSGEARSLLETWRDDLFSAAHMRAVYFVPRDDYDRMLPIRITPAPRELVRVGLVIERL
jgi:hypothetical protein